MNHVLVLGAGKIGTLISTLLSESGSYKVTLADAEPERAAIQLKAQNRQPIEIVGLNASKEQELAEHIKQNQYQVVVSCLPYYCNPVVAKLAKEFGLHYFDLTEDVEVTEQVKTISESANTMFSPQCGLAPGFISIAANALMENFEEIETVKMRVGALPQNPSNALKYSLTWSTDGLINEYGNTCYGIEEGGMVPLQPLEGYETISLDGVLYEAFNTSGGLGTLADTYDKKVQTMNYKTMRYPGHCEKIQFLMNDLDLNHDRDTLKRVLENSVPQTMQDVVLVYVSVTGRRGGKLFEENFARKVYPQTIAGSVWSAIQVTTAAGLCGSLDILLTQRANEKGFVRQESISLNDFLENRFGKLYNA